MKKTMIPVLLLLLLVGCTNYQKEVAKDCPSNAKGSICIDDVPLHISQYADALVLDTLALFSKMRFVIEADEVDWVYKMEEGKLKIHSRYMTPIQSDWVGPVLWFLAVGGIYILLILFLRQRETTFGLRFASEFTRQRAAEAEIEAAKEMQAARVSVGTKESDLIAKQAMLIDSLTEEVDKIIEYKEWKMEQLSFNAQISLQSTEIQEMIGGGVYCSDKVQSLLQQIISHSTQ